MYAAVGASHDLPLSSQSYRTCSRWLLPAGQGTAAVDDAWFPRVYWRGFRMTQAEGAAARSRRRWHAHTAVCISARWNQVTTHAIRCGRRREAKGPSPLKAVVVVCYVVQGVELPSGRVRAEEDSHQWACGMTTSRLRSMSTNFQEQMLIKELQSKQYHQSSPGHGVTAAWGRVSRVFSRAGAEGFWCRAPRRLLSRCLRLQ